MRMVVALVAISLARAAHADPAADANKALQAFVDAAAAKKLPPEVGAFITPGHDSEDAIGDLDDLHTIVGKPALKILSTHVAKSGTAAWIVGEIGGASYMAELGKTTKAPLRASAFLTLDGGTWHVRAAHWSGGTPNAPKEGGCGNMDTTYEPPDGVGKGAEVVAKVIQDAFPGAEYRTGKLQTAGLVAALSDDKAAVMFGSAPEENFTGGAAIKNIFKRWKVDLRAPTDGHMRAGIAPGKDLAWVATEITTDLQCTAYRALFVLQQEKGAWKIVHQHFSSWVMTP